MTFLCMKKGFHYPLLNEMEINTGRTHTHALYIIMTLHHPRSTLERIGVKSGHSPRMEAT